MKEMKVIKTNIYITRGDTASLTYEINFNPSFEIREVYFTVKKNARTSETLIQKSWITDGTTPVPNGIKFNEVESNLSTGKHIYVVEIDNSDTASLDFGQYRYDIQINYLDDADNQKILTIVEPSVFEVQEEITNTGWS